MSVGAGVRYCALPRLSSVSRRASSFSGSIMPSTTTTRRPFVAVVVLVFANNAYTNLMVI